MVFAIWIGLGVAIDPPGYVAPGGPPPSKVGQPMGLFLTLTYAS